ncbi:MAG: pyruvate kinase, partial [Planctomycetota bacterium]
MTRHAKIVCTIGPACADSSTLKSMLQAGMNCARMNFSHGTYEAHLTTMRRIRSAARALGRSVAILQDLQGPKIRTGLLEGGKAVDLEAGASFTITTRKLVGNNKITSTTYPKLATDVRRGSRILIDDGRLELVVKKVDHTDIHCEVVIGGELGQSKGINLPGVAVSAPPMSRKDWADLKFGIKHHVDLVALSFVREASDITEVRRFLGKSHAHVKIVAKIERPEAVKNLDAILEVTDGLMVARGDLGVEMEPERMAILQKDIIRRSNKSGKFVITATHMLDSMISNPRPTRAEISDVSNAVFDGTDAVMLSGETATGKYPVRAVQMMSRIVGEVESSIFADPIQRRHRESPGLLDPDTALVASVSYAANLMQCSCLGIFTRSGRTAWNIAKARPFSRILAFTSDRKTYQLLSLAWGVHPLMIRNYRHPSRLYESALHILKKKKLGKPGEVIL